MGALELETGPKIVEQQASQAPGVVTTTLGTGPLPSAGGHAAATWMLYPDDYEQRIQCLRQFFVDEV